VGNSKLKSSVRAQHGADRTRRLTCDKALADLLRDVEHGPEPLEWQTADLLRFDDAFDLGAAQWPRRPARGYEGASPWNQNLSLSAS